MFDLVCWFDLCLVFGWLVGLFGGLVLVGWFFGGLFCLIWIISDVWVCGIVWFAFVCCGCLWVFGLDVLLVEYCFGVAVLR